MSLTSALKKAPGATPLWHWLNRRPAIRRWIDRARLRRMYGQFWPEKLQFAHSGNWLFVDPRENRGRAVLLCRAAGQPIVKNIWRRAAEVLQPTIVLDVGLNYGEFLFAETYPAGAAIFGVEANRRLRPWIEKSVAAHPNRDQIGIAFALAASVADEESVFIVDPSWSGRSSAVLAPDRPGLQTEQVPSITVDSLVASRDLTRDTLLFKIDVEGFEPAVIQGMRRLLADCPRIFGFMEFNSRFLRRQQVDIDGFLGELAQRLTIFPLDAAGRPIRLPHSTFAELCRVLGKEEVETDLLLTSDPAMLDALEIHLVNASVRGEPSP